MTAPGTLPASGTRADLQTVYAAPSGQNAPAVEAGGAQISDSDAAVGEPIRPLIVNPKVVFDQDSRQLLIQIRNEDLDVVTQYPSEREVEAYKKAAAQEQQTRDDAGVPLSDQPAAASAGTNPEPQNGPATVENAGDSGVPAPAAVQTSADLSVDGGEPPEPGTQDPPSLDTFA